MAVFEVQQMEGMRSVRILLDDEVVQTEARALATMDGSIEMVARIPSPLSAVRSVFAHQSLIRPKFSGSGIIHLDPSVRGYHMFEVLEDKSWILSRGAYWASESSVKLSLARQRVMTSLWSGEGFIYYQTKLSGHGKVVLNADGPVDEVVLKDSRLKVDGRLVIARTEGIKYTMQRSAKSILSSMLSGQGMMRTFEGTGSLLLSRIPFWNKRLLSAMEET